MKLSLPIISLFFGGLASGFAEDLPLFEKLESKESGVDFTNPIDDTHPLHHLFATGYAAGSVTVADFDGDSKPDLFFTGGPVANALYLQSGESGRLAFTRATCGVESPTNWGAGAAAIDVDGDRDLDLYVCNYDRPNELFMNLGKDTDGALRFEEKAEAYGLGFSGASLIPNFADYDRDGDLDLFLLTSQFILENGRPQRVPAKVIFDEIIIEPEWQRYFVGVRYPDGSYKIDLTGAPDRLFRNDGEKGFVDVTEDSGIEGGTFGLSTAWLDYDHDGWSDLYVASDFETPDKLWRNAGDGTFTEVLAEVMPYCSWASMGLGIADFDGNGLLDLIVADMGGSTHFKSKIGMGVLNDHRRNLLINGSPRQTMRNCLLLDSGVGRFHEAAFMAGLSKTDWTWSCKAGDFDNDGKVDVFFTNGMSRNFSDADHDYGPQQWIGVSEWDHYKGLPPYRDTNRAFRNRGDLDFENTSASWGLDHPGMSFGAAMADLDLDGDLDLVTCNLDEEVQILRNRQSGGHGLLIQLQGEKGNHQGIGAKVTVKSKSVGSQVRSLQPSAGFLSYDSSLLHFGIGADEVADIVTIHWPDGKVQVLKNLEVGKTHVIQKEGSSFADKDGSKPEKMFQMTDSGPDFSHLENSFEDYDDFRRQPLLPIRLSRDGPAMAWAGVDGDGDDDAFFGGARHQAGEFHLNEGGGKFRKVQGPWSADARCEDMGILWFDVDQDGDLDLFVASGGPESFKGASALADRLYLNEGELTFTKAVERTIPSFGQASSSVSAADYDRDGDLDLFIGTRCDPNRYPRTPESRLLRNDGGKFTDVTTAVSEALRKPGMVTSSCWSDLNNDQWPDLVLAIDYGAVQVFLNEEGKLRALGGLGERSGWWNSVATADLDGDGRMDIIAGNTGLNTKYGKLEPGKTVEIFYGEMDDSGIPRIVEAKVDKERPEPLPVRGRG